ncbi:MAG: hypothetical protein MJE77_26260 [Proteobacteria bacterium]|nr:hypothetical protein [Pseudomonadota bacterium]
MTRADKHHVENPQQPARSPEQQHEWRRLDWGLAIPATAKAGWGARAIYAYRPGNVRVELVYNRQSGFGDEHLRGPLQHWLNTQGLQAIQDCCQREELTDDSARTIWLAQPPYYLLASPNASCGYLYLSAWMDSDVDASDRIAMLRQRFDQ